MRTVTPRRPSNRCGCRSLDEDQARAAGSGVWRVERFTVDEHDAARARLRGMIHGGRCVPAGTYTRLMRGGTLVMSDTPDELRDLYELRHRARTGLVLITGLGLGCAVEMFLDRPGVKRLTVVENGQDVIALVAPHLTKRYGPRLIVEAGDAFTWRPPKGVRYSAVWHDIWDNICGVNVAEMTRLKRRYGRFADWQGCWCEYQCRRANRQFA